MAQRPDERPPSLRHPLRDAHAKLVRAFELFGELQAIHDDVLKLQLGQIRAEPAREMTINGMHGTAIPMEFSPVEIPERLGMLVGEVTNALRSALDYIVGELALLDSGVRHDRTQFPVLNHEKDFDDAARKRNGPMSGLFPRHIEVLRELQPFRGTFWTADLAVLSNTDKHRYMIEGRHDVSLSGEFRHNASAGSLEGKLRVKPVLLATPPGIPVIDSLRAIGAGVQAFLDRVLPDFPSADDGKAGST